jgi:hypothetical protein
VIIDPAEDIGEPSLRVDVIQLGGLDQREHRGAALATPIRREPIMPGVCSAVEVAYSFYPLIAAVLKQRSRPRCPARHCQLENADDTAHQTSHPSPIGAMGRPGVPDANHPLHKFALGTLGDLGELALGPPRPALPPNWGAIAAESYFSQRQLIIYR